MSANDPKRTSASISCCSSEAGFSPYQSTRLSRYDASSEPGGGHAAAGISACLVERQRRDFALSVTAARSRRVYDMTVTDHIPVQAYRFPFPGFDHIRTIRNRFSV